MTRAPGGVKVTERMREYERFRKWLRSQGAMMSPLAALAEGAIPEPVATQFRDALARHGKVRKARVVAQPSDPDAPSFARSFDAVAATMRVRPEWMTPGTRVTPTTGHLKGKPGVIAEDISDGLVVVVFDPRPFPKGYRTAFYPGELTRPVTEEGATS
jgi:hypothetical protein